MNELLNEPLNEPCKSAGNPFEFARLLCAFVDCSTPIQNIVLEMADIISDPESDEEDRVVAFDAMMEALFPGKTADTREGYHTILRSPKGAEAASELRAEQEGFATRVRKLMKEKGITQEDLANAAEITQPAVSNLLARSCRPQRRTVEKFASALGVSPTELWPEFAHTAP